MIQSNEIPPGVTTGNGESEEEGRDIGAELVRLRVAGEGLDGASSPPSDLTGKEDGGIAPRTCRSKLGLTYCLDPKWKTLMMMPNSIKMEPQEREIQSSVFQTAWDHGGIEVLCLASPFSC